MSHEFIAKNGLIIGSGITQAVNHISNNSALTYDSSSILTENAVKRAIDYNITLVNAGVITQPTVTNRGNGSLDIGSCNVQLYDNPYNTGTPKFYTIPALSAVTLTVNVYYYLSVYYNGGNPIYDLIIDNTTINHSDRLNALQLVWENTGVHNDTYVFTTGNYGLGLANKIGHRLIHTERFGYESGFGLTVDAGLHILLTNGKIWYDGEEIDVPFSIDTNTNPYYFYYKSGGAWTSHSASTLNVTQYNNGTNLATLSNNHYAVAWVFRNTCDNDMFILPGEGDYTLSQAQSSSLANVPIFMSKMCVLVGKIITEKNSSTITQYIPLLGGITGSASAVAWGSISGNISNQTDLISLLNNKQNLSSNLTSLSGLTYASTSFVKMTGANTFSLDTNTYTSTSRQIIANSGTGSINGGGDLSADRTLTLVGDSVSPGNSRYYGTDSGGTKGFFDLHTGDAIRLTSVQSYDQYRLMTSDADGDISRTPIFYVDSFAKLETVLELTLSSVVIFFTNSIITTSSTIGVNVTNIYTFGDDLKLESNLNLFAGSTRNWYFKNRIVQNGNYTINYDNNDETHDLSIYTKELFSSVAGSQRTLSLDGSINTGNGILKLYTEDILDVTVTIISNASSTQIGVNKHFCTTSSRQIIANSGTGSINGGGDLSADRTLTLVGDSVSPGNNMLYGTNASGVKGWYIQPTGSGGTSSVAWTDLTGNITSSQFATALTDETGNGRVVFSTGATMLNTIISGLTVTTINGSTLGSNAFTSTAYQPLNTSLNSITALTYTSTSFIKMTGANAFSLDTNTYLNSSNNLSDVSNTTTALLNLGGKPYHGIVSRPVPGPLPTILSTTTFTLSAASSNVTYYYNGKMVLVNTNKTTTLAGAPGLYFIYFDTDTGNILNGSFPGIIFTSNVLIASVFWNGTNYGLINDERHGYNRNLEWHDWAHNTIGCRYKSGIDLTHNGGTGAAATFATTSGEIRDEDIRFTVNASSAFPTANAGRIFYQSGATTYTFLNTPSTVPFHRGVNNRPNVVNATTFALTELPSAVNRYCNVFVYATTDMHTPIYFVTETMPAATVTAGGYTSTANARSVSFPNLASYGLGPELKPIYRIVVRADGVVQALIASDDYRLVSSLPMSAGNTSTNASAVSYNPTAPFTQTTVQTAIDQTLTIFTQQTIFDAHTGDTTIHFTKSSIYLDNLGDVNTGGTIQGYILTYSGGTWVGAANVSSGNTPTTRQIIANSSTGSVSGGGDLTVDRTLTLVGDSVSPGNSKYYGTNSGGTKGFYDLPTGSSGGTVGVPTSRQIIANSGTGSIIGGGDLTADRTLTLVGDSVTPGNYKRYGTNSGGTKGYYTIPYTSLQYTLMEDVNNNSVYFYSYIQANASTTAVRSGTASNGLQNQFGCSPIIIPQNGKIIGATFLVKGAAVANGSVTYPCTLRTNLYTVGWTTEGSVLSTIDCIIPNSGTPVGTYSVADTNGKFEVTGLDINVVSGQPLALKWIALVGGASNITIIRNLIVTLWFVST